MLIDVGTGGVHVDDGKNRKEIAVVADALLSIEEIDRALQEAGLGSWDYARDCASLSLEAMGMLPFWFYLSATFGFTGSDRVTVEVTRRPTGYVTV